MHPLVLMGLCLAGSVEVDVQLSKTEIPVNDFVTVQVSAVSTVGTDLEVTMPEVPGLREISRSRREGTSFSFGSGGRKVRREVILDIDYVATRVGEFSFPPVEADAGSISGRSAPVDFVVLGPPSGSQAPVAADPDARFLPPGPYESDAFVRYRISKDRVYRGEQLIVELFLLVEPGVRIEPVTAPIPSFDGVWTQVIDKPSLSSQSTEKIAGKTYAAYRLWKVAVFPLEAKPLALSPAEVVLRIRARYGRSGPRMRRTTQARTVEVSPLPSAGRPKSFPAGNVGRLSLSAEVDQDQVESGRGLTLTLRLQGAGNVSQFALPEVDVPGFRSFPPSVDTEIETHEAGVVGQKTAEILLTPQRTGRLQIPSLAVWSFDPEVGRYRELRTEPIRVVVQGPAPGSGSGSGAQPSEAPAAAAPAPSVLSRSNGLRPILTRARLTRAHTAVPGWVWPALLALPWLVATVAWVRRRPAPKDHDPSDAARRWATRAHEAALRQDADAWRMATAAFSLALLGRSDGHPGLVKDQLEATSLSESDRAVVREALEQAEALRYAPSLVRPIRPTLGPVWKRITEALS